MAGKTVAGTAGDGAPEAAVPDRATLTDKQLAKAVLARTLRPRVGEMRRLAEAVLSKDAPKKKGKKAKSGKLAKIPRQKKK